MRTTQHPHMASTYYSRPSLILFFFPSRQSPLPLELISIPFPFCFFSSLRSALSLTHHHRCNLFPPFTAVFDAATTTSHRFHSQLNASLSLLSSLRHGLLPSSPQFCFSLRCDSASPPRIFLPCSWNSWFGSLNSQLLVSILVLVFLWVTSLLEFGLSLDTSLLCLLKFCALKRIGCWNCCVVSCEIVNLG